MISSEVRLLLLISVCALLWSLETMWPLQRFRGARLRRVVPNVVLTVFVVLLNLALSFGVAAVSARAAVTVTNALLGIVALDLATYAAHVVLHKLPFAWRFHRVHHSEPEVDVTTAFRQHPGETLWRVAWQLPPIVLLGLPFGVVVLYLTLSTLNAQLEHANLRVPERTDRVLRLLFVTPNMHKVHHSRLQRETDSNYSNLFSLWDRLFGTYTGSADLESLRYGLDGFDEPRRQTLRGLLGMPFAAGLFLLFAMPALANDPPKQKVLFLCPHGGAKSVIAASYFNKLAEVHQLPITATAAAAEDPYDAVPPPVEKLLAEEGFDVAKFKPRHVEPSELTSATAVVSIGCDLTKVDTQGVKVETWDDVPMVSEDLPGSAAAIRKHAQTLLEQLKRK